jgi:hypothetical protein
MLKSLATYTKLELNHYQKKKLPKDGNQGPRCIAFKVYGNIKEHRRVRREVY